MGPSDFEEALEFQERKHNCNLDREKFRRNVERARKVLRERAAQGKTISYGEVAQEVGIQSRGGTLRLCWVPRAVSR